MGPEEILCRPASVYRGVVLLEDPILVGIFLKEWKQVVLQHLLVFLGVHPCRRKFNSDFPSFVKCRLHHHCTASKIPPWKKQLLFAQIVPMVPPSIEPIEVEALFVRKNYLNDKKSE